MRVRRLVAVDDAGRIVNPLLAEGQVIGGAVQGLGAVLTEEQSYTTDGRPLSSLLDYALLTAAEIPEFATAFVETPSPLNPLGVKGVGEGGTIGAPRGGRQRARGRARRPPRRSAVHRREGLAGAAVTWEQLLDPAASLRDAHGTIVLEEVDEDTRTATFRVYGAAVAVATVAGRRRGRRSTASVPPGRCWPRSHPPAFGRFVAASRLAMKPAPFEYVARAVGRRRRSRRCSTTARACWPAARACCRCSTCALVAPGAAGRHQPAPGLGVIRRSDGVLQLGATVRQAALERSPLVARALAAAGPGRPPRRPRRDPLARHRRRARSSTPTRAPQLPAALAALDALVVVAHAHDASCRAAGELLEIEVPPLPAGARTAYAEYARTRGVFADAGAAVVLAPGPRGDRAARHRAARPAPRRRCGTGASAREAAALAAEAVEGDHRRALVADVTRRALDARRARA